MKKILYTKLLAIANDIKNMNRQHKEVREEFKRFYKYETDREQQKRIDDIGLKENIRLYSKLASLSIINEIQNSMKAIKCDVLQIPIETYQIYSIISIKHRDGG